MEEILMNGLIGKLGFSLGDTVFFLAMVFCIVVPYLLGSINFAVVFSKTMHHDDVRTHGSGNAGSTNMLRTYGMKAAALTFAGDILKGVISTLLGLLILPYGTGFAYVSALCCMLGHAFPIYYGFKGGKGISVAFGSMMAGTPVITAAAFGVWLIVVGLTKYVSLASILAVAGYTVFTFISFAVSGTYSIPHGVAAVVLPAIIIYAHRSNIVRLMNGTERKIGEKK